VQEARLEVEPPASCRCTRVSISVRACACVRVCVRACMLACVRACVRACGKLCWGACGCHRVCVSV